jgi:hypothetical protein
LKPGFVEEDSIFEIVEKFTPPSKPNSKNSELSLSPKIKEIKTCDCAEAIQKKATIKSKLFFI